MAEAVDSVIAEFVIKGLDQYESSFNRAVSVNKRFERSALDLQKLGAMAPPQYAQGLAADLTKGADAHEKAAARIKQARKSQADTTAQAAATEAKAAKASADAVTAAETKKQAALEATARKRGSVSVAPDLFSAGGGVKPGTGAVIGIAGEAGDRSAAARQTEAMRQVRVEAEQTVVTEAEINQTLLDQAALRAGANAGDKESIALAKEKLTYLNLYNAGIRANLSEEDAQIFAEERILAIKKAQFEQALKQVAVQRAQASGNGTTSLNSLRQAAEGSVLGYAPSGPAFAGIAAAAAVGLGVEAVKNATDYAKALTEVSHQAGLSAESLQVYQHAAVEAGAKSSDLDMGLLHLSENLGRARTGSEEQAKAFAAIGVSIKTGASAGDLLPTLIARISSITDQSTRARIELALFGESGAKLDGLLSGGNAKVNDLADALQRAGSILSSSDIARLDDVSKKLDAVKAQLQVDLAQVVAGNAESIESLAKAFSDLANDIFGAIHALDEYAKTSKTGAFLANPAGAGGQVRQYLNEKTNAAITALGIPGFGPGAGSLAPATSKPAVSADKSKVQPGKVNQALLDKLGAPKGPKGRDPNIALNEADERTKHFNDTIARYQALQEAAIAQQTSDEEKRADQQRAEIQRAAAKDIADLKTQADIDSRKKGADVALIQSRLSQAITARQAAASEQENVVALQENLSAIRRDTAAQVARLDFSNQLLQDGERSTDTSAQRQKTQLEILANEEKIKELTAQEVLRRAAQGDPTITKQDIADANRTIADIPAETAARKGEIIDRNKSPGQTYRDSLDLNTDTIQQEEVKVLDQFNQGLDDSVKKALHLHGIFGDIISDLVDMAIKQALIKPLAGSLFGGAGGGGGLGGLLGKGLGLVSSIFGGGGSGIGASIGGNFSSSLLNGSVSGIDTSLLPHFATGGSFGVGGNGGIDRNVMSINGRAVAMVNQGETVNIVPHNSRARAAAPQVTVLAPRHFDLSGAVLTQDLVAQINADNKSYTDSVGKAAYTNAVSTSGKQAPGAVRKAQVLGS